MRTNTLTLCSLHPTRFAPFPPRASRQQSDLRQIKEQNSCREVRLPWRVRSFLTHPYLNASRQELCDFVTHLTHLTQHHRPWSAVLCPGSYTACPGFCPGLPLKKPRVYRACPSVPGPEGYIHPLLPLRAHKPGHLHLTFFSLLQPFVGSCRLLQLTRFNFPSNQSEVFRTIPNHSAVRKFFPVKVPHLPA